MIIAVPVAGRTVKMTEELNVDPAALRSLADAHREMAAFYREIAAPDMASVDSLYLLRPPASDRAREFILNQRTARWISVGHRHDNIAGVHDLNASAFEAGDIAGAGRITRRGEDL
jgi:hypothetical protein